MISPLLNTSDSVIFQEPTLSIKIKKGIGFGMIKEELSLLDKFKLVKDLGFDGVEFDSPVDFNLKELVGGRN